MDFSRYENLRALVRANFSETTHRLVDEALEYADGKLAGVCRYDGAPMLDHAAAVASIVISEVGLGRNSAVSSILHDVVRLAHKERPADEFLAPKRSGTVSENRSWASRWGWRTSRS